MLKWLISALALQPTFSETGNPKQNPFKKSSLKMDPPNDVRNARTNLDKYTLEQCNEMQTHDEYSVEFYSKDCEELNGGKRKFYNINRDTLSEIVEDANDYWCNGRGKESFNCDLRTQNERTPAKRIKVCAVSNIESIGDSIRFSKEFSKSDPSFPNNKDGSYIDIRLQLNALNGLREGKEGVRFNVHTYTPEPTDAIFTRQPIDTVFIHEVGHAAFNLRHPKDNSDSIMQNKPPHIDEHNNIQYYQTDVRTKMSSADKTFVERCIGSKSPNAQSHHEL